jgi:hypothetical protein
MKTVLSSSTDLPSAGEVDTEKEESEGDIADGTGDPGDEGATGRTRTDSAGAVGTHELTPEQLAQLKNGLEIDLGLDAALDLGLGQRGGMNWFDLGLLPHSARASVRVRSAASGRESPSVYSSQAATPRVSVHEDSEERRSTTSTKADAIGARADNPGDLKFTSPSWWQKVMLRIRRIHTIIATHTNRHWNAQLAYNIHALSSWSLLPLGRTRALYTIVNSEGAGRFLSSYSDIPSIPHNSISTRLHSYPSFIFIRDYLFWSTRFPTRPTFLSSFFLNACRDASFIVELFNVDSLPPPVIRPTFLYTDFYLEAGGDILDCDLSRCTRGAHKHRSMVPKHCQSCLVPSLRMTRKMSEICAF